MGTRFSVIIPSYNTGSYISSCINSVLSQTFKDYEIIVVDDCSSDNGLTESVLNTFSDIKVFHTEKNSGPGSARNIGIANASGEYILFLDSDDTFSSNDVLEKLNNTIGKDSPDIIYMGFQFIGEEFLFIPNEANSTKKFRLSENKFINVWSICWSTRLIKQNEIHFQDNCYSYEDVAFAFWGISLAKDYKIADYVTYYYTRNREDSSSSRFTNYEKHFKQSRETVTCIETLFNLRDKINPNDKAYLVKRIEEQKSRLLVRIDRGLKELLEEIKIDNER